MEAEAADKVTESYKELKAAGAIAATSHEKRKNMVKLTEYTTDLLESTSEIPTHMRSTTEMQLMKKRRQANMNGGASGARSQFMTQEADSNRLGRDADDATEVDTRRSIVDVGLMRRASVARLGVDETSEPELWQVVETLASEAKNNNRRVPVAYKVQSGKWNAPTPGRALRGCRRKIVSLLSWTGKEIFLICALRSLRRHSQFC